MLEGGDLVPCVGLLPGLEGGGPYIGVLALLGIGIPLEAHKEGKRRRCCGS